MRIAEAVVLLVQDQQTQWRGLRAALAQAGIVLVDGPGAGEGLARGPFSCPCVPVADAARRRSGASVSVHPQSRLLDRAALLRAKDGKAMNALIRMPNRIERFVRMPQAGEGGEVRLISIEAEISSNSSNFGAKFASTSTSESRPG